ncbi:hypothetical protein SAMN05660337_3234 [Maridesulfovibrio ferrireducens]|uniref:Uncharacterized protein n=1 Tax=Maridesulfovibrio ferrireducens TaxID=246191 RepID=A0A1G9KVW5_9BACT|nr:hypothetical protein [Maridesulfovibrio ferrireducens]SDL53842.1 hypothetical protein SAMN05660337_3234 [Maridesulfovibrio ferrireducens]
MPETYLVTIDSGQPEENKPLREAIFISTTGKTIASYDVPQWLTEDEIDHLKSNGFTVISEDED